MTFRYSKNQLVTDTATTIHKADVRAILNKVSQEKASSDGDLRNIFRHPGLGKPAAVLVIIEWFHDEPMVWLTKRANTRLHAGQVALPGGRIDDGESGYEAARREAFEEIGFPLAHPVQDFGEGPHHLTITDYLMRSFFVTTETPFPLVVGEDEVSEAFRVPLSHLLDKTRYSVQSRMWQGSLRPYYTNPYGPYYIWGATARLFYRLANIWDELSHADD